jgi:hypothetical protein
MLAPDDGIVLYRLDLTIAMKDGQPYALAGFGRSGRIGKQEQSC